VAAVQEWDPAHNRLVAQIPTGPSPHLAQHFPGMPFGVVVVQGPGEIQLFDPASHQVLRSIAVGQQPHWMDRGVDSNQLLVSNEGSNSVSIVDLPSGQSRTVAVGNAPRKIAVQHPAGPSSAMSSAMSAATGAAVPVSIANFNFEPMQIKAVPGQTVTWTNRDGAPHGLAFQNGAAGSALLLPGQSFSRKFDQPGSFDYVCSVHPYMTGKVLVGAR
jgi:YVTN family beta-propeller protein